MANQLFADFAYDDAGVAIVGATVNLYDRNTTTPVRATTTTDANGYWSISHATEGRFDSEVVSGTTKRRRKWDTRTQFDTLEVAALRIRNPAFTFEYDLVPAALTADRQLNWPLITAEDTLASLGLAQTFSAVKTFSAIPEMTGGAVGFPATQVASADANDFDDYEEGAWTPAIAFGGASAGQTTSQAAGRYTKIGNRVLITWRILLTAKGSSTGDATVTGLPFTAANAQGAFSAVSLSSSVLTFADWPKAIVSINTATVALSESTNAGAYTTLTHADFADTTDLIGSTQYEV